MVIAGAAGLGVGAPELSMALLGQCQRQPELLAKSVIPAQQMCIPRLPDNRGVELLVGRGRGADVSARVRGLDLLYERLEVGGALLWGQFLQPVHAGQLDYLARREQIVDLLIG